MPLIVGLGNPGAEYEWTRHNLGFMLIDRIATATGALVKRRACQSLVGNADIAGRRALLVKPQTYMNLSGEAVKCLQAKYEGQGIANQLIVISDDLALPLGTIRIRPRGSAGGHNGLKSLIAALGSDEFVRLRIGIQPEHELSDTKSFVLDEFPKSQRPQVAEVLARSAEAVQVILRDGVEKAMSLYN
ncbi:MAG: peptidyl-tRNA hydrolase, family [Blastocatellia bacterium]|jgi:PTH1 family peptidyl-tRNA hydrolase|nr:peptidyl-tRNA hydrolase, family [Blastocatellia bacterium]